MFKKFVFLLMLWSGLGFSQQDSIVDFLKIEATVTPKIAEKSVEGIVKVFFNILQKTDSVYLDAQKMQVTQQAQEGVPVKTSEDKIWFVDAFEPNRTYTAFFSYTATPKQALYFAKDQIWTQGQGKYTSHWLPSLDAMTDKIEYDLSIKAPAYQKVIANGSLEKFSVYDDQIVWHFNMDQPMSSYLAAFVVGDFKMKKIASESDIPIELYYLPKDSLKFEPTYRYTKEIFDFLETEIGVAYPWQNYKQVPVRDFLYAGMENTTCTIFSEAFVVDSIGFIDRNYVNVNTHELAHQWFGNLVTEIEGTHHWLHEGFATYYALLAEKKIFGEDYFYWKLYNSAEQLKALSDKGKGQQLLNPKASSLTFYEKGAWALHRLREIIGDEAFKQGIQNYLQKYAFHNVTTDDFLNEIRTLTSKDLTAWENKWLRQSAFQAEESYESLLRSDFMKDFFELSALRATSFADKEPQLRKALQSSNEFVAQEAVYQLANEDFINVASMYDMALQNENLFVRQAVALSMDQIPSSFRQSYETLLKETSYLTQEAALYNLWVNFPEYRTRYLEQTDGTIGFQDKNVRQLWLALALSTQGFREAKKPSYLSKLIDYSSNTYSFEVRQKALEYLFAMGISSEEFIQHLVNACTHHYWRFRDAARTMLDDFVKKESNLEIVLAQFSNYSEAEKTYIQRKFQLQ